MKKAFVLFSFLLVLVGCDLFEKEEVSPYIQPLLHESYFDIERSDDENVRYALEQAGLENKDYTVQKLTLNPNKILILEAKSELKNIFAYEIDFNHLEEVNYDLDMLIKENEALPSIRLGENIQAGEVMVILCIEPDTIPQHYIGWTSTDGTVEYHVIQFNGKGE